MSRIIGFYSIPDIASSDYPSLIHDHNLVVLENGKIETYLHLERITGIKYDASMQNSVENIARKLNLIPPNDTFFIFVDHEIGRACISKSGQIRLEVGRTDQLSSDPELAHLYWFGDQPAAYILNHELAHLYSCVPFYGRFKENSLLIHYDGGASKSNFSAWTYKNKKVELVEAHYNLKWLSSLFNANALVFSLVGAKKYHQNSVPGKFMGLEAYGKYRKDIEVWLRENEFFADCWSSKKKLFDSIEQRFNLRFEHIDNKNKFFQNIAATIHAIFMRESLLVFERLAKATKSDYLYYAGGTALNIKLNKKILDSGLFKDVFIPPCTNDSGLALGAAVALALKKGEVINQTGPFLNNYGLSVNETIDSIPAEMQKIGEAIADGKILGVCNGFAEIGPRALGNRSIIARADRVKLAVKMSRECKNREWYRPVAPIILEKNLKLLVKETLAPEISAYMLTEFNITSEGKKYISGCVHYDNTSRIQVIKSRTFNPFIYDLLDFLDSNYGLKGIINTSFNRQGEPIVQSHDQAIRSAIAMKLDGVILDGNLQLF